MSYVKELAPEGDAPKKITEIQFGMMSPNEIPQASHLHVVNQELFVLPERSPFPYGVLDQRLGVSRGDATCNTCGLALDNCAGHFGHVKLELPVFHIGYFKATLNVCQAICKRCNKVMLAGKERATILSRMRAKTGTLAKKDLANTVIIKCRKVRVCPHCEFQNGVVKKIGAFRIIHDRFSRLRPTDPRLLEFRNSFQQSILQNKDVEQLISRACDDLTPLRVKRMFENIPAEDCELLDMDPVIGRPERMITTHIPVPPVCIRPSVVMNHGSNEDYLTTKLTEIIRVNNTLKAAMEKGGSVGIVFENYDYLQLQTALLINSDISGLPFQMQSAVKEGRSLVQRLKGKKGRFRGNLSGKRVDFTGRTVISPDPNLRIDQVAVPKAMAKKLTYPERVTQHNIERLKTCVVNGPDVHPGANNVIMASDGVAKYLKHVDRNLVASRLRIGDTVERHLCDGDVVLFNRQPSLHKLSIMSHNAKVMDWHTLRFNECVCGPYNADFDGDEMNLHLPQTEEARAEANVLMGVQNNLVTPRNGDIIIAATQDFLTGAWLLTKKNAFFDRAAFCQLCSFLTDGAAHVTLPSPTILKPVELWTGKQVINTLLLPQPKREHLINLQQAGRNYTSNKAMCKNDGYIIIRNSQLMCGTLDKKLLGDGTKNSVFAVLLREVSPQYATLCMSRLAKLTSRFLMNEGFSIGIDDVTPGSKLISRKEQLLSRGYGVCDDYISQWKNGRLETQPGCNAEQTLEAVINRTLSALREDAGEMCRQELHWRNAPLNMALAGSKGSLLNISQMIACVGQQTVNGTRVPNGFVERSLPHFFKRERSPAAKGFVSNSFFSGLAPTEFFFHTMGGREGLVDTAVKTAETGYMQRRLMKTLEDLSVQYDNTVRNSEQGVVQFTYGDDGLDPANMEGMLDPSLTLSVGSSAADFSRMMLHTKATEPCTRAELLDFENSKAVWNSVAQETKQKTSSYFTEMMSRFVNNGLKNLESSEQQLANKVSSLPEDQRGDYKLWLQEHQVSKKQLETFGEACAAKYKKAVIDPGTAVGALAAQSIGEPCTQMTLKTFHFAGVASMNITLGVPRIKEIINASKSISTPIITAALESDRDVTVARVVKGRIETTKLGDISSYIREVYEPAQCSIEIQLDLDTISKLQLDVDADVAKRAILRAKLKLKPEHVLTNGKDKIKVTPVSHARERLLFELQFLKNQLRSVVVVGIPTVDRAVIHKKKDDVSYELLVEGSDLRRVMATLGVNGKKTTSNHIIEVEKTLGIEAARKTIMNEIGYTVGAYGIHIDSRHVMLLADVMTYRGSILGITRFGIGKMKESVLMLASFEKTTDHLFDAAVHARRDNIVGVSECIIMGIPIPLGTGCFKLIHKLRKVKVPRTRPLLLHSTEVIPSWSTKKPKSG